MAPDPDDPDRAAELFRRGSPQARGCGARGRRQMPPRSSSFQDRFQRSDRSGTPSNRLAETGIDDRGCLVRSLTFRTVYAPMKMNERSGSPIDTISAIRPKGRFASKRHRLPQRRHAAAQGLAKKIEPAVRGFRSTPVNRDPRTSTGGGLHRQPTLPRMRREAATEVRPIDLPALRAERGFSACWPSPRPRLLLRRKPPSDAVDRSVLSRSLT